MPGQLWIPAAEAVTLSLVHEGRDGWRLVASCRREGERWDEAQHDEYRAIASAELQGLVDAVLGTYLSQDA